MTWKQLLLNPAIWKRTLRSYWSLEFLVFMIAYGSVSALLIHTGHSMLFSCVMSYAIYSTCWIVWEFFKLWRAQR